MSTGMPRPLSTTVTLLSSCTVTLISSQMQAELAGGADVHRRPLADGFEAAENFDGSCVVLVALRGFLFSHYVCVSSETNESETSSAKSAPNQSHKPQV